MVFGIVSQNIVRKLRKRGCNEGVKWRGRTFIHPCSVQRISFEINL